MAGPVPVMIEYDERKQMKKRTNLFAMNTRRAITRGMLLCAVAVTGFTTSASAQDSTCDSNIMRSIEDRAWLEAQREITQNQNLIVKPDSVLEYTCFGNYLENTALVARDLFSETSVFGDGLGEDSMDEALEAAILPSFDAYIDTNFSHNYLGGRSSQDYDVPSSINGAAYTCREMIKVWNIAKCMNFIEDNANDGFFTFQQYVDGDDKRALPSACDEDSRWANMYGGALKDPPWLETFQEGNHDAAEFVQSFLNPGSSCAPVILTGVMVRDRPDDDTPTQDAVCLNPDCRISLSGTTASCGR